MRRRGVARQNASIAANLPPESRKKLAIKVLAKNELISDLAAREKVSRKFLYHQKNKAISALDRAFSSIDSNPEVLFYLPVTKTWLKQLILALILICHSSYRGVQEILRDLFDYQISIASIHNLIYSTAKKAKEINERQDLSKIKVDLKDEIFQANKPVLTGMDNASTYCYLLTYAQHRDRDTWCYHLLNLTETQGLNPEYSIADAAKGLRAGQGAAWPNIPCHGDIFHIKYQCQKMVLALERLAIKKIRYTDKLDDQLIRFYTKHKQSNSKLMEEFDESLQKEEALVELAEEVKILIDWLNNDILITPGGDYNERLELYNFIIEELKMREKLSLHRIRPVRKALENQREDILAFVRIVDRKLVKIANKFNVPLYLVRQICLLQKKTTAANSYWQTYERLYQKLGYKFHCLFQAVIEAIKDTPKASSMVENLNSRLRNYFFLRKQLGQEYLNLLQFFLNHRTFMRSEHPERVGFSPTELLTGEKHPHWLELLGFERFKRSAIAA